MHEHICTYVSRWTCTCMSRGWHGLCSPITLHLIFDTGLLSLNLEHGDWVDWLASMPERSFCFYFPAVLELQTLYYYISAGDWIELLMLMRQTLYQLSHFPSPMFVISFIELHSCWTHVGREGYKDDHKSTYTTKYQQRHCKASRLLFICLDEIAVEGHRQVIFEWKKQILGMRKGGRVQVVETTITTTLKKNKADKLLSG